jgi:hypothetical protein
MTGDRKFYVPAELSGAVEKIIAETFDTDWEIVYDDDSSIVDLTYYGDKYYTDMIKELNQIAQYVRKGSYIEFCLDDCEHFRWYFDGKKCVEQRAHIIFCPELTKEQIYEKIAYPFNVRHDQTV